jgi:hypothetical protein
MDILETLVGYLLGGCVVMAAIAFFNRKAEKPTTLKEGLIFSFGWFFALMNIFDSLMKRAPPKPQAPIIVKEPFSVKLEKFFEGKK